LRKPHASKVPARARAASLDAIKQFLPFIQNMNSKSSSIFLSLFFIALVFASALSGWEMSVEQWGYWYFARVLKETGLFVIADRSPVYTIYLNLFSWIGYPHSVELEYMVTTLIGVFSFYTFLKPFIGRIAVTIFLVLWIPVLQLGEPSVQLLSLSCVLLAAHLRISKKFQHVTLLTYFLFYLAGMLRLPNFVYMAVFFTYDMNQYALLNLNKLKEFFSNYTTKSLTLSLRRNITSIFVVFFAISLSAVVFIRQSPLPLNNAFFADTRWFPVTGKSLSEASIIQYINWQHISKIPRKPGVLPIEDWFFTNKDIFPNASGLKQSFLANPQIFIQHYMQNITKLVPTIISGTVLRKIPYLLTYVIFALFIIGLIKYLQRTKDVNLYIYTLATCLLILIIGLTNYELRYMLPVMPLVPFSASGLLLLGNGQIRYKSFLLPLLLLISSNFILWKNFISAVTNSNSTNPLKILTYRGTSGKKTIGNNNYNSLRAAYPDLLGNIKHCKNGVLTLEATFVGAFLPFPISKTYGVYALPPFSTSENSNLNKYYDLLLATQKIDCIFLSNDLKMHFGWATNTRPRYLFHVKPYIEYLLANGWNIKPISGYGWVIIPSD